MRSAITVIIIITLTIQSARIQNCLQNNCLVDINSYKPAPSKLCSLQVEKSVVDQFTGRTTIPKCQMILEWENEHLPPKRMHQMIGIQGARNYEFIHLVVDPGTNA